MTRKSEPNPGDAIGRTMPPSGRTLLFAGSFNPFTIGHKSIADRALQLADRLIIAIGVNPGKPSDDAERNRKRISEIYKEDPRVEVTVYSGLTVDLAKACSARFLVRGVRSCADFEYERNLADINQRLAGIETILLTAYPEMACISSSMVRELMAHGTDPSPYLP